MIPNSGDEMAHRADMEASENMVPPIDWSGGHAQHGIQPERIAQALGSDQNAAGFCRLELMLTAVLPRLEGEQPRKDRQV
jgi:hypothetical protein